MSEAHILIAYDGSPNAQLAIDRAAEMFPGCPATVLTVWEGLSEVLARTGAGLGAAALDIEDIDITSERLAAERAQEGAARARDAGLGAHAHVCAQHGAIWETILAEAQRIDANAIVVGTRGLTGLKSALLGSVSHGVLQHSERPVIVVPPARVGHAALAHHAERGTARPCSQACATPRPRPGSRRCQASR